MNDNALIAILIAELKTGMVAQSITVGIQQGNQPRQQSVPSTPFLYLTKLSDNRFGHPFRENRINNDNSVTHIETEWIETHFQLAAGAIQNPNDIIQLTAADYLKYASKWLQSDNAIRSFISQGVGIYRIQAQRQTYFKDEQDRYESSPLFEFTLTHKDELSITVTSTDAIVPNITVP